MTIDDPTRYISYQYNGNFGSYMCDSDLAEGWYKFLNHRMYTSMANRGSTGYCYTQYRGILQGGHPSVGDGVVSRQVCFYYSSSCNYYVNIKVRNCGSFFVYKLKPTPTCNLRYCTIDN